MRQLVRTRIAQLRLCVMVACVILAWPLAAGAQGALQIPMQFDFLNPGARSLALAGAFAGLADDATAAFTNPAGLLILRDPEFSFEGRGRHLESPFLKGGRLSGPLSRMGIDTTASPIYDDSISTSRGLSYLSFVYPAGNWAIAGYRHEFVRIDQSFEANGVFQGVFQREFALQARREVAITAYGGSAAYRIAPKLSVGGSVALYTFDMLGEFNRFSAGLDRFFEAPTFDAASQATNSEQHGDGSAVGFNIGGLFTIHESTAATARVNLVQVGLAYRSTPSFAFTAFEGAVGRPVDHSSVFRTPDAFAMGLAVRFTANLMATAEVTWVQYESLLDGYVSSQSGIASNPANYKLHNGVEFHAGTEYVFDAPVSPAIRVGVWRDPDHALRYDAPTNPGIEDERLAAYLPPREAHTHFTLGGGVSLTSQLEINVGADLASQSRQFSVSAVVRIPK
jgi:long-subunit fatty acid transport protein